MKTLVITGAEGQLGQCFRHVLAGNTEFKVHYSDKSECDLTQPKAIEKHLQALQPDVLINCAAYTQVDGAEHHPQLAAAVNAKAVKHLVQIAEKLQFTIVHFSTDYVFDGSRSTPYLETTTPNPINHYGKTKLAGEQELFKASTPHCCIRTSWLFSPYGKNFVKTILQKLQEKKPLTIVNDQWARPTYGIDLARAVLKLLQNKTLTTYPLYHFANAGVTSWYDFAQQIAKYTSNAEQIQPQTTAASQLAASRPKYTALATERIQKSCNLDLRSWDEALNECINILNEKSN